MRSFDPDGLFSIGEFADASQLSVRMLRHYDDIGLLEPAWRDPRTGYRYYKEPQLRRATAIALLRAAEVPLAEIVVVLSGAPAEARQVVDRHRQRLAREHTAVRRSLAIVERLVEGGWTMSLEIEAQRVAPVTVVYKRVEGRTSFAGPLMTAASLEVSRAVTGAGITPSAVLQLVHVATPDRIVQDACIAVDDYVDIEGFDVAALPDTEAAVATYQGPFGPGLSATFHAVSDWIAQRGWLVQAPYRMEFLAAPPLLPKGDEVKAGSTITRFYVPFVR